MNDQLRPPPEDKDWLRVESVRDPSAFVGAALAAAFLLVGVVIFLLSD